MTEVGKRGSEVGGGFMTGVGKSEPSSILANEDVGIVLLSMRGS